jgi:peroxiredoxin
MDLPAKITAKLATLFVLTSCLCISSELSLGGFVKAQGGTAKVNAAKKTITSNKSKTNITTKATAAQATIAPKKAPDFSLPNTAGKVIKLSDFKGKIVVLEWFNHRCPFVKKHYESGNMQKLQKDYAAKEVVWLSICSSAPGKSGYGSAQDHEATRIAKKSLATHVLLDVDGTAGHAYGATATPHMFVISKDGKLAYGGAMDNNPSLESSNATKNYVKQALDELLAPKAVSEPSTKSYGCPVKY